MSKTASELASELLSEQEENPFVDVIPPVSIDEAYAVDDEDAPDLELKGDAEFIDALENAKKSKQSKTANKPKVNSDDKSKSLDKPKEPEPIKEEVKQFIPPETVEIELPKNNWLKINQEYLDGATPFHSWKRQGGVHPPAVAKAKAQYDNMLDLGYKLVSTSISSRGHYVFMFFELPEDKQKTAKVPQKLLDQK